MCGGGADGAPQPARGSLHDGRPAVLLDNGSLAQVKQVVVNTWQSLVVAVDLSAEPHPAPAPTRDRRRCFRPAQAMVAE
jgi:hypothetical protein